VAKFAMNTAREGQAGPKLEPLVRNDGDLQGVDWAAFDAAQDPSERPLLFDVYPEYRQWFESTKG
jgi:hypothetical protein